MKRIILMCLSIFIIGCSVQEEVPSQEEDIPLKQEEEVVEKEYVFTKAELPYNNYDGKASQTYLYENRPKIEDDGQFLEYELLLGSIDAIDRYDVNYNLLSIINVFCVLAEHEGIIQKLQGSTYLLHDEYYKIENIFLNYPEAKLESEQVGENYPNQMMVEGEIVEFPYPVYSFLGSPHVYHGETVRRLYRQLYNEECPINETIKIDLFSKPEFHFMVYDEDVDLFVFFKYGDGAQAIMIHSKLYLLDSQIEDDLVKCKVAIVNYAIQWNVEETMYFKNSGLPILERHFSNESKKDGKLTISELLKDQKDNIDIYQLTARINEDGTYTLLGYENQTPIHEAEDFIFYMNYEREDGKVQLLPLFDVSYAKQANQSLLTLLEEREDLPRQVGWYEDENIAVIWVEDLNTAHHLYAIDKNNHRMLENIDEENEIYQQFIKQYSSEEGIEECKLFEMGEEQYLFVDGLIYQVNIT